MILQKIFTFLAALVWATMAMTPDEALGTLLISAGIHRDAEGEQMVAGTDLQLRLFSEHEANSTGARCLDGSPSGYYFSPSTTDEGSSKWVVFLQGGGLCITGVDCRNRAKGNLGSSKGWAAAIGAGGNLMSVDPANPFSTWNRIFVPYCSGDTHTGQQRGTSSGRWSGLRFSGHLTLAAIVNESGLLSNTTTEVVLGGSSAGGIGTNNNADWLQGLVAQAAPAAMFTALPQASEPSGTFLVRDFTIYGEEKLLDLIGVGDLSLNAIIARYFVNSYDAFVDETCRSAAGNEWHRCWDASFHYQYITSQMFIAGNLFDTALYPIACPRDYIPINAITCPAEFHANFGQKMLETLEANSKQKPGDGLWLASCARHTENTNIVSSTQVKVRGSTLNEALVAWRAGVEGSVLVDDCVAADGGPCNVGCT